MGRIDARHECVLLSLLTFLPCFDADSLSSSAVCTFIVGYAPSLGTIAYTTIELIRSSTWRFLFFRYLTDFPPSSPSQPSRFAVSDRPLLSPSNG